MVLLKLLAIILLIIFIFCLITIICSLFVKNQEYSKHSKFYRFLLNIWTFIAIKIMRIKIEVEGFDNIPSNTRFLLVGNHRSNFDPIITWYIFKKYDIAYISKEENFKIPIFGKLIRKCCFTTIDRENPKNAFRTLVKASKLIEDNQVSIGIYPEGTRNHNKEMLPFHNGVFKIAKMAKVPIVIVSLQHTDAISKNYPFKKSIVKLHILKIIDKDEVSMLSSNQLGEVVRGRIEDDLKGGANYF